MEMPGVLRFIKEAFSKTWDRLAHFLRVSEVFPPALAQDQDAYKNITVFAGIRSDKDTHFTMAIAVDAKEDENLTGFSGNKGRIKRIKVQSEDNRTWEVWIWKKDTTDDIDLDLDAFCAMAIFNAADSRRIGGANQYYYDSGALDEPYEDLDGTSELHVSVVNRGPGAKVAGAAGELIVDVDYEPAG